MPGEPGPNCQGIQVQQQRLRHLWLHLQQRQWGHSCHRPSQHQGVGDHGLGLGRAPAAVLLQPLVSWQQQHLLSAQLQLWDLSGFQCFTGLVSPRPRTQHPQCLQWLQQQQQLQQQRQQLRTGREGRGLLLVSLRGSLLARDLAPAVAAAAALAAVTPAAAGNMCAQLAEGKLPISSLRHPAGGTAMQCAATMGAGSFSHLCRGVSPLQLSIGGSIQGSPIQCTGRLTRQPMQNLQKCSS